MGKGTRSRNARAGDIIADPAKFSKKNNVDKSKLATRIGVAACTVLLVACLVLWAVTSWVPRILTVARSENYKINGSEMTYFVNTLKNNYINTLSQYGTSYLSTFGIDSNDTSLTGLKSQTCALDSTKSWYDYFVEQAKSQVESMLVLCEVARAEGMKLDDSDKETIDESIKAMKESAEELAKLYASNGYSGYSASYFLTQQYGNGVSESNVRHAMELSALSSKFYDAYQERVKAGITDDELEKYCTDNPASLLTADVYSYTFTAELELAGSEATDEEKSAYESDKAAAKKLAEELAACTDKDSFIAKAHEYIIGTYASDQFDSLYEDAKSDIDEANLPTAEKLAEDKAELLKSVAAKIKGEIEEIQKPAVEKEGTYEKALGEICDDLLEAVQSAYDSVKETSSVKYSDPTAEDATDITKWLFASDRKAGDTTSIASEADKKSTYTAYFVDTAARRDESITKNVGHILFKKDTYGSAEDAKAKAEEILAEYKSGEQTKEAFEALANQYNEDSNIFYENVVKDYMVESFDAWIYDESRKVGDVDIVETTYGAHIMYFVGDGEVAWKSTALSGVFDEKYNEWYEAQKTEVGVSFKDSALKNLG